MAGGVSMARADHGRHGRRADRRYLGTWLEHKAQSETEKLEDLLQHH
jgi:hypothetical protein